MQLIHLRKSLRKLRRLLQFFRLDSASVSITLTLLGFGLAGGNVLSFSGMSWGVFGLLFHLGGYADNNIQDFEHDLRDANKASFPLGKGIAVREAHAANALVHLIGVIWALHLSGSLVALCFFTGSYASGLLYNRLTKRWRGSPLLFAMTFGLLPLFPFVATAGVVNETAALVALAVAGECFFQNAFSTSIKDVQNDQVSPARSLGVHVYHGLLVVPFKASGMGFSMKSIGLLPVSLLAFGSPSFAVSLAFVFCTVSVVSAAWLLRGGAWEKRAELMLYGTISDLGLFYAILVLSGNFLGTWATLFLAIFPVAWYALTKRFIWGNILPMHA